MRHVLRLCLAAGLLLMLVPAKARAQANPTDDYAWAAACKTCHAKYYDAWDKTKHSNAIMRLSGSERDAGGKCIGCHTTAVPELLDKNVNAGIQCEGCHGPGKAHIAAAAAGETKPGKITRVPDEKVCVACHSEKSPHFKYFLVRRDEGPCPPDSEVGRRFRPAGRDPRYSMTAPRSPGSSSCRCAHHGAMPSVITRSWNAFRSKRSPSAAA